MKTSSTLRFAAAAFAAIAAIACSKDDTAQPGNPDTATPFTITASIDDGADTRISMTDDGATKIELKWRSGDQIFVANEGSTSATEFAIVAESISADGKTAAFQAPAGYTGTPQYAVHQGFNYFSSIDPTDLNARSFSFPSVSSLPNYYLLYARYDAATGQFAFRPLTAILKLDITLPDGASGAATNIRFATTDGSEVFYSSSCYDITGESPVRTSNSLSDEYLLSGSVAMTAGIKKSLYIPIQPGTELAGKQLEISMVVDTDVYTATITGGNLEAGKCYPLTLGTSKWTHFGEVAEAGTGTAADPYLVRTERNLKTLAKAVLTGKSYYTSTYFKLDNPIALTTSASDPWLPIGTDRNSFNGTFDGNNQTISGDIHLSDKDGRHLGLFGQIYSGSVSKLTVDGNIIYNSNSSTVLGGLIIGGIVGYTKGTLTDCTHSGAMTLENTALTSRATVGGIAGYCEKEISGCTQQGGTISVNMPQVEDIVVGGIVGEFTAYGRTMHTCKGESNITVTGKAGATLYVGTLAGDIGINGGTVYDCSTAQPGLTVTVNGEEQNPPKAVGHGNDPVPCDIPEHTAQQ